MRATATSSPRHGGGTLRAVRLAEMVVAVSAAPAPEQVEQHGSARSSMVLRSLVRLGRVGSVAVLSGDRGEVTPATGEPHN